ncbi:hypothetical protein CCP3SC1AL1_470014 [Gammaproteobacteria bacterium]
MCVQDHHSAAHLVRFLLGWPHKRVEKLCAGRIDHNAGHLFAIWTLKVHRVGRRNSNPVFAAIQTGDIGRQMWAAVVEVDDIVSHGSLP